MSDPHSHSRVRLHQYGTTVDLNQDPCLSMWADEESRAVAYRSLLFCASKEGSGTDSNSGVCLDSGIGVGFRASSPAGFGGGFKSGAEVGGDLEMVLSLEFVLVEWHWGSSSP